MAILAGLIGEDYGTRPHEVLGIRGQSRMEQFWTDAAVRQATVHYRNDAKDAADGDTGGGASRQEMNELQDAQESRAKVRESMEQAGKSAPSVDGQLEQLNQLEQKREQAADELGMNSDHV